MSNDPRTPLYHDLHQRQLAAQAQQNRHSARVILGMLFEILRPQAVLDVGCGLGSWLAAARDLGVPTVQGLEGPWLDPTQAEVDPACLATVDLEQDFALGRTFDLVICLEVAEHLPPARAESFIRCLTAHGQTIVFSAAIPFQGGHNHVNEQYLDYWQALFARHDYRAVDLFRGRLWGDDSILWWLRQNVVLFAHQSVIAGNERLQREAAIDRPLSIVHPAVYGYRMQLNAQAVNERQALVQLLGGGGLFRVTPHPNGQITIDRVS